MHGTWDLWASELLKYPFTIYSSYSPYSADKLYCECSFHVHIVGLSIYFSLTLLNIFFHQKFYTTSFGILLTDIVDNHIFNVTAVKA